MKVGVEIVTDMKALAREIQESMNEEILKVMVEVCHEAVEKVRTKMLDKAYQDDTGNLNSSTGFIIYLDGKIMHQDFRLSNVGTDKQTGLDEGLKSALSVLRESKGWGIVMASGMEYASWVQSRGFEVGKKAAMEVETALASAIESIGQIL